MSVTKKIIDLAKANLNSLLERAAETVDPRRRLATIPDAELEAELARRRSARLAEEKVADAKARIDGAPSGARAAQDREARERAAREREQRVRAAREARERVERERAARAQQQQSQSRTYGSSSGGPRPGAGSQQPPPRARGKDPDLARYYERLEIAYGSDWETVRASYRKLMRKYHPDLHANKSAEKQRAAHEVSQALTQAYNELERHLLGGPNRRG